VIREVLSTYRKRSLKRILPVMITGEGKRQTGKESGSHAPFIASSRREMARPFFFRDQCGRRFPKSLIESETVSGNERGSFTGADRTRPGAYSNQAKWRHSVD